MAGEWIKVSLNLHTKPEVFKLARLISENVDTTVGMLVRFWAWADGTTVDGVVDGVEAQDVDAIVKKDGFCNGLIAVGWLRKVPDRDALELVNFSRHNGESAKKRALKNERQARWRSGNVDAAPSTKASTREEKRREEITTGRATRLPPDWVLPEDWRTWAQAQRPSWPQPFISRVAEDFRDYWIAKAGKDACKTDWLATWRKWVRNTTDPKNASASSDPPWKGAH